MYVVSLIYFTICHYICVNFTVQYIKTGKIAPLLFRNDWNVYESITFYINLINIRARILVNLKYIGPTM